MAAGDVTITRGVGARDDGLDANLTQLNSASVSGTAVSSDGDTMTYSGTFTNPAVGDVAIAYRPISNGPNSSTFKNVIVRWKITSLPANYLLRYWVHYANSQVDANTLGSSVNTNFTVTSAALIVTNQIVDQLGIEVFANTGAATGSFNVSWDFIYVFKETLTLPAASSPLTLTLSRYVVELPIPTREGGVLQDLGSASAQLEVAGTLITTTSPNNYTGDQWWDVLVGTWLEANWQWLSSDRVAYKYQIENLTPTQDPGKVGFYGFKMRLRKVDIITAAAQTFASGTGTGAIQ